LNRHSSFSGLYISNRIIVCRSLVKMQRIRNRIARMKALVQPAQFGISVAVRACSSTSANDRRARRECHARRELHAAASGKRLHRRKYFRKKRPPRSFISATRPRRFARRAMIRARERRRSFTSADAVVYRVHARRRTRPPEARADSLGVVGVPPCGA
jgi:hypothetical protein